MIGFEDLDRFMWTYARNLAKLWNLTSVEIKTSTKVYVYSCLKNGDSDVEFYIKLCKKG